MVFLRKAVYAGIFYPSEKKELEETIKEMLSKAKKKNVVGKVVAAIVPHAGYNYSGWVAAGAYNEIEKAKPKKIVLLGPSHQEYLNEAFSFAEDWETPLGVVKVCSANLPVLKNDSEHSLEVQLPFLQSVLKDFGLVPIIYGNIGEKELADTVKNEEGFVLVSSDLSHYHPYENANKIDWTTIQKILELDVRGLAKEGDACGLTGIIALVILAKERGWKPVLLDYRNSGDTAGDRDKVVGYASIVFTE